MSTTKKTIDSYNKFAHLWSGKMKSGKNNAHKYIEKPAMLSKLPDLTNKKVLALACGSAEEIDILKEKNPAKIVGVDISSELIEIAKINYPEIDFFVMDMEKLDFGDEEFDYVFCSLAFHYLQNWNNALSEIHRILKKDATLLFSTHHPLKWGSETFKSNEIIFNGFGTIQSNNSNNREIIGDYFAVKQDKTKWFEKMEIDYFNRPLSLMFREISDAKFKINDFLEPKISDEAKNIDYDFWKLYSKIPMFVIWECKK